MKIKTYTNSQGKFSTDDFDPDVDVYDPVAEERRDLYEQEVFDDFMNACASLDDDFDDGFDAAYVDGYDEIDEEPDSGYDDPYDLYGSLYPDD